MFNDTPNLIETQLGSLAAGRHLAGLTKRRLAEAALFQDEYLA